MKLIAVYTTVATRDGARAMARALVERKLAACAQVGGIESFYWWKDSVQDEPEYRLMFKTTEDRYAALEAAIRELHPYELPAIYSLEVQAAFPPYAQWVEEHSSGG